MSNELFVAVMAGDVATVRTLLSEIRRWRPRVTAAGCRVVLLALFHQQREVADACSPPTRNSARSRRPPPVAPTG